MSIYTPFLYRPFREDVNKSDEAFYVYTRMAGFWNKAFKKEAVSNFDEFCDKMGYDPINVLYTFYYNHLKWNTDPNGPVFWPNMVIKKKEGRCFDFALFMHYYFQHFDVDHIVCFISVLHPKTLDPLNHAFPIYFDAKSNKYQIWQFDGGTEDDIPDSDIIDGKDSPFELLEDFKVLFIGMICSNQKVAYNPQLGKAWYLDEKEIENLDRFKNRPNIYQIPLLDGVTDKRLKTYKEINQVKQKLQKGFVVDHRTEEEQVQDLMRNSTWIPPLTKQQSQLLRKLAKKAGLKS